MPRPKKKLPAAPGGAAKAQRHDLVGPAQAPAAPTGMAYGAHAETINAQRAVPLPADAGAPQGGAPPQATPGAPGGFGGAIAAAMAHPPPDGGGLAAPTGRPNEPVTHGMPSGPGAGPEALNLPSAGDDVLLQLRTLYKAYPLPQIAELIAEASQ